MRVINNDVICVVLFKYERAGSDKQKKNIGVAYLILFFLLRAVKILHTIKGNFFQPIRERVKQKLHVNLYELLKYIVFCIGKTKQLYHGWSQQDSRVPRASLFPEAKRIVEIKIFMIYDRNMISVIFLSI